MISDLAPVDLLLQRAGRLHRHKINEENRPPNFDHPRLAIARPPTQDEIPDFGLDTLIYDEVTLLRTWLTLFNREEVILPQDTGPLIETVYPLDTNDHQYNPKYQKLLQMKTDKANLERGKEIHEARQRLIARPDYEDLLSQRNDELEEDDAKAGQAFRALTRLGEPSISLVCLYQMASVIGFDLDSSGDGIDLCQKPSPTLTRKLLQNSVNVQRKDVVNYFINHDSRTAGWKKSAALRDYYPVIFDAEGFYRPEGGGFVLKLSREFGLEVLKAEG
jgi:CRISPR-associated endonuclease/helicase Cas3